MIISTFQNAIWVAAYDKDKQPLINLLRSDYPLTAEDKEYLADFIEEKPKRGRGRRPWRATDELNHPVSAAVRRAAFFIGRFKEAGRKQGRSRQGMHAWAIDQTMEFMKQNGFMLPPRERLENYLRRSRKSRVGGPR